MNKVNSPYKAPAIIVILMLIAGFCMAQGEKIKGLTMVAPPQEWESPPVEGLEALNTEWISLVPYGFNRKNSPKVIFGLEQQWWGEREEGIKASIEMAHANGIKVMLKPQVYIHQGWVGDMDFEDESDWAIWESSYRDYILTYAKVAATHKINLFCIGTEYKVAVQKRTAFWRKLINEVRSIYGGEIVYSANWDSYQDFPFWSEIDYVGVSAYFPLIDNKTPSVPKLIKAWKPIIKELKSFADKENKQVLFTEYGYMSIDGCAYRAWEIEKDLYNRQVNEVAQANAYEALLASFFDKEWWAGGFLWKFFPHGQGHEGYIEKDYTPQGKKAAHVIAKWYAH